MGNGAQQLLERRRTVDVGGVPTPTLDTVDTLVHVCAHASQSGADRLIWLADVQLVANTAAVEEVVDRALSWEMAPAVAFALLRAGRVLGATRRSIELEVARRLVPRTSWRMMSDAVGRIPVPYLWNPDARSIVHSIARAAHGDVRRSQRELMRRGTALFLNSWRRRNAAQLWDAQDPDSAMYAAGNARDRAAYFAAVANR